MISFFFNAARKEKLGFPLHGLRESSLVFLLRLITVRSSLNTGYTLPSEQRLDDRSHTFSNTF